MRDKYKPRQAVESQERAKWTTTEDEFIIKAEQRFTGHGKWVKIAKLLPGRSNILMFIIDGTTVYGTTNVLILITSKAIQPF